jgi:hypothetical protein
MKALSSDWSLKSIIPHDRTVSLSGQFHAGGTSGIDCETTVKALALDNGTAGNR